MTRSNRFQELLTELKKLLKKRKVTYAELAQHLNQSESSVKRFFTGSDGSMGKLLAICDWLDVDLEDLLAASKKTEYTTIVFSKEQQEYLVKNRGHFLAYWSLTAKRMSPEQVQNEYKLSDKKLFSILHKLDQMGLIELLPNNKVKVPPHEAVLWSGDGPLMHEVVHQWSVKIVQQAAQRIEKDDLAHLNIRYLRMLPETYNELRKGLVEHMRHIEGLSVREERMYPEKVQESCIVTAAIPDGIF